MPNPSLTNVGKTKNLLFITQTVWLMYCQCSHVRLVCRPPCNTKILSSYTVECFVSGHNVITTAWLTLCIMFNSWIWKLCSVALLYCTLSRPQFSQHLWMSSLSFVINLVKEGKLCSGGESVTICPENSSLAPNPKTSTPEPQRQINNQKLLTPPEITAVCVIVYRYDIFLEGHN